MNHSIFVVFLLVLVAVDLSSAWRRRRKGFPNNNDKIPKEMKLERESEPVQNADIEERAPAMDNMMTNEDRVELSTDNFVENDNEL